MARLVGVFRPSNMRDGLCAVPDCQSEPAPGCEDLSIQLRVPPLCRKHLEEMVEQEAIHHVHES